MASAPNYARFVPVGFAVAFAVLAALVAVFALSDLRKVRDQAKRANEALASRIAELQTLHATGRELSTTLDPQRILDIVERECRKTFSVDGFFIGRCDPETNELTAKAAAPLDDALASWILRDKRGFAVDDAATPADAAGRPPFPEGAAGSVLAVPLLVGERAVGLICLHNRTRGAFDEHQLSVLSTIAQQAASALESARRHALATIDAVTGLVLREEFLRQLEDEYVRGKRYPRAFSLLMLDLDAFKDVNDRQGHAAGDRYLRELGAAVKGRLRAADVGSRYGGDELCVLLPETELAGAGLLAERLREAVAHLVVDVDGTPVRTTASIGIASFPAHDTGASRGLLVRADEALHRAKRAGGNRVA